MEKKTKSIIAVAVIAGVVVGGFLIVNAVQQRNIIMKVFHAGSLAVPLQEVEKRFEAKYKDVDVQLESAGSVECISKITQSGKIADVLASADWTLIPAMPQQYQDYVIKFAVNKMVLCYTDNSKYTTELKNESFWQTLQKSKWGFSNPNLDPCGYRTLMTLQLAELKYADTTILDNTVIAETKITVAESAGVYTITVPEIIMDEANPSEHVVIRDKSVDLVTLLQEGGLDYAFEYKSVAEQFDLKYMEFESAIDLSDSNQDTTYAKVKVVKTSGTTTSTSTGKSITYGITVPKNAIHADLGAAFIEMVIDATGKKIFEDLGQPALTPCPTNNLTALPENLKTYCVQV